MNRVVEPAAARAEFLIKKGKSRDLAAFLQEPVRKYQSSDSKKHPGSRSQVDDYSKRLPSLHAILENNSLEYNIAELCQASGPQQKETREHVLKLVLAEHCPVSNQIVLELEVLWTLTGSSRQSLAEFCRR
jgi:hypothetical protein